MFQSRRFYNNAMVSSAQAFQIFTLHAKAIMASPVFNRRLLLGSITSIIAYSSIPLLNPNCSYSLGLAQGEESKLLPKSDRFVQHVTQIARKLGVAHPENLSIHISESCSGASVGANATIGLRGACLVLPYDIYAAFHATPEERLQYQDEIPTMDEINFVLAHEAAHLAKNHSIQSASFLPFSLLVCGVTMKRIPNKLLAGIFGVGTIITSNVLLSWRIEHEADHLAGNAGYASGGIQCFQRSLSRNCQLRSLLKTRWITKDGNYIRDTSHPWLTTRIHHLQKLIETTTSESHHCQYCLHL